MKFRKIQFIFLALLFTAILSSCNNTKDFEESIIIFDDEKHLKFTNMLDEEKIEYRVKDGNQVFYPTKKKEIVLKAFEKVTGKKVPAYIPPQ